MKAFMRVSLVVLGSLLTLAFSFGGGKDLDSFRFVGLLLLMFWGLPMIVIVTVLDRIERVTGLRGRNVIAAFGLVPLLMFPFVQHHDPSFASVFLIPGVVWFVGWLLTSAFFVAEPMRGAANSPEAVVENQRYQSFFRE